MKEKVSLRDTTMKTKNWLEIEKDGRSFYVSLRTSKGILGGERTEVSKVILQSMTHFSPGVIVEVGPMHFYRTEEDVRIAFDDDLAEDGLSGYDRVDHEDLVEAIQKVVGRERSSTATKKKAAPKTKRRVASARKKPAKSRK